MLTSKQRSQLRALASTEDTILIIGKGGITEQTVLQCANALKARELVKGRVLESALLTPQEAGETLCEACRAELVQVIGSKFVLFRRNTADPKIELAKRGAAKPSHVAAPARPTGKKPAARPEAKRKQQTRSDGSRRPRSRPAPGGRGTASGPRAGGTKGRR